MDYSEDAQSFYLNEQNRMKRKELEEKYGGDFHKPSDSDLSPEIENQFLNNIEQFEAQFKDSKLVKIIDLIGNQKFKSINKLSNDEIAGAIEEVLDIYAEHNINIDIIEKQDVTDRDFYIFLTERLPNEETDDINLPGWTKNFIYEEFYPSNKLDAKDAVEDVLLDAAYRNSEDGPIYIAKNLLNSEGEPVTKDEFLKGLYLVFHNVNEVIEREFIYKNLEFSDRNIVNVDFIIRYKEKDNPAEIDKIFNFTFELSRCEFGGMNVFKYKLNK